MSDSAKISIIVCIKEPSSRDVINSCIESLNRLKKTDKTQIILVGHEFNFINNKDELSGFSLIPQEGISLLGGRDIGLKKATGEFILLLDSNHMIDNYLLDEMFEKIEGEDVICIRQEVRNPRSWIQRLYAADRRLINKQEIKVYDPSILAAQGGSLTCIYRRDMLNEALQHIPEYIKEGVNSHDHALIMHEAIKLTSRIGYVDGFIKRIEPETFNEFWKINTRYGRDARVIVKTGYKSLFNSYENPRFRKGTFKVNDISDSIQSLILLGLKSIPIQYGYRIRRDDGK